MEARRCGRSRARTCDLSDVTRMLSQLSYSPIYPLSERRAHHHRASHSPSSAYQAIGGAAIIPPGGGAIRPSIL